MLGSLYLFDVDNRQRAKLDDVGIELLHINTVVLDHVSHTLASVQHLRVWEHVAALRKQNELLVFVLRVTFADAKPASNCQVSEPCSLA